MNRKASSARQKPTTAQSNLLRRIATTGGLVLQHSAGGDEYFDRAGGRMPTREARQILRHLIPNKDSLFDLTPQSWRARGPQD